MCGSGLPAATIRRLAEVSAAWVRIRSWIPEPNHAKKPDRAECEPANLRGLAFRSGRAPRPASTAIGVSELAVPGTRVEIRVIAVSR